MPVLRVRGVGLPDEEPVDLYADGDRWTADPVDRAGLVAEGWLLPGLVDAHTHPGAAGARPAAGRSRCCAPRAVVLRGQVQFRRF